MSIKLREFRADSCARQAMPCGVPVECELQDIVRVGKRFSDVGGFTLIEVLISAAMVVVAVFGLVYVFVMAARGNAVSHESTFAAVLASEKLEQLRGLAWGFDSSGVPTIDATTDVTISPEQTGGTGLTPSPPGALSTNTSGYCDFLDARGRSFGTGTDPPLGTIYVRRWSIDLVPSSVNALVLQVRVIAGHGSTGSSGLARVPGETRLFSVKTRKAG